MYHHPPTPRLAEHQLSFISVNNRELILSFFGWAFWFFQNCLFLLFNYYVMFYEGEWEEDQATYFILKKVKYWKSGCDMLLFSRQICSYCAGVTYHENFSSVCNEVLWLQKQRKLNKRFSANKLKIFMIYINWSYYTRVEKSLKNLL